MHPFVYALDNPLRNVDPSGRAPMLDAEGTILLHPVTYRPMLNGSLRKAEETILREYGQANSLEGLALTSDVIASVYRDWPRFLQEMGRVFIGTPRTGPGALLGAVAAGRCAGMGREPRDCPGNVYYWSDTGFHPDFRDWHNQPYHVWGYIAQTAAPGDAVAYCLGHAVGLVSNNVHEQVQSVAGGVPGIRDLRPIDNGWGTSWQDFVLSYAGMEIGLLISSQSIAPTELGDVMRERLGTEGPGSRGALEFLEQRWGPLRGETLGY